MSFSPATFCATLDALTPAPATGFVVALSGGADSAALLAALVLAVPPIRGLPIRAVHVDHGLHLSAGDLRRACEALCERLHVGLLTACVTVDTAQGLSLEAAARDARYGALAAELRPAECLLTAHHADDQAETLLLQLLRGAGVKGLSAMPACRPLAAGWQLRPLLGVTREALRAFGASVGVSGARDPMNEDERFDRVYLRERVWPLLRARWPGAARTVSRTAGHVAQAQHLLDQAAAAALDTVRDGPALSVTALRALGILEQRNVLRYWVALQAVPLPSSARLDEALRQMLQADGAQLPVVAWGEHALRRYRDALFLTAAVPPAIGALREWPIDSEPCLDLGSLLGTLHWVPQAGGLDRRRLPDRLVVRQRRGGEALRPQRGARTQSVQHLCQALGVVPWMRDALPLVYAGTQLVAVGDLWHDAGCCVARGAPGFGIAWHRPAIVAGGLIW